MDNFFYLYQSVETTNESTINKWRVHIHKNGMTIVQEQLVAEGLYQSVVLNEMKVGDKDMTFTATKVDGSSNTIHLPYNGKTF